MKNLILVFALTLGTLTAFSQEPTDHPRVDSIYNSFESLSPSLLSNMIKSDTNITLAINICTGFSAKTSTHSSTTSLSKKVISIITDEIGTDFIEIERAVVVVDKDIFATTNGMMVVYEGANGKRIKINLFLNDNFEIEYITLYKSSCDYF